MATAGIAKDETIWGHPKGLFFLAFTEMWERFSFYGMRTLLILYMVQDLLVSDRADTIVGMAGYRSFIEAVFGPLSTQAFASQTFGLYAGFVYFTPLFGGLLADKWLGAKKTVMIGIALMTLGHIAMVFDWSFLIALLLLVLGSGCLKGNIAAQVGHLYPRAEVALRSRGYTLFSTGINIGAVIGPVVCGALAQYYGWHVGFGTAGAVMLIAAVVYFSGLRHFAEEKPAGREGHTHSALTRDEWHMIGLVVAIVLIYTVQSFSYDQLFNVGLIWVSERVDLSLGNFTVPVPWLGAEDSFSSIIIVPVLIWLWRRQAEKGTEPDDLGKINIGGGFMIVSTLCLAAGSWTAGDGKASLLWPVLAFFFSGVSFMYAWPTLLALVSRRAPAKISALMMAGAYLAAFVTGVGSGFLARFYEPLGDTGFWLMQAGITFAGIVLMILVGRPIRRRMDVLDARVTTSADMDSTG